MQFRSIFASLSLLAIAVTALPNNPVTVTSTVTQTEQAPTQTVTETEQATQTPTSQCNTNQQQVCCTAVGDADSGVIGLLAGLLGIVLGDVTGIIGLGCVDLLGSGCNQQAACCNNVVQNGLINTGCSPISIL